MHKKVLCLFLVFALFTLFIPSAPAQGINPSSDVKKILNLTEKEWNELPEATRKSLEKTSESRLGEVRKDLNRVRKAINKKSPTWNANYNPVALLSEGEMKKRLGLEDRENFIARTLKAVGEIKDTNKEYWNILPESTQNFIERLSKRRNVLSNTIGLWDILTNPSILLSTIEEGEAIEGMELEEVPDFFSWAEQHGFNYITPVKNQSSCGSCWAFAVVGSLEGVANTYYNNPGLDIDLAEQDLVSCSGAGDCDGGWPEDALQYIENNGIATEECFPYTATNNDCNNKCSGWQEDAWTVSTYYNVPFEEEEIKSALITKGPLVIGMDVYSDFKYYEGGIYSHVWGDFLGNHAIVLVGYGVYDGKTYWICKNSWGTDWGENGYFRIFAGECGIDSFLLHSIESPVPPVEVDVICVDSDNDGYCVWGLGNKPVDCPACNELLQDCNDMNGSVFQGCGQSTEKAGTLAVNSIPSDANVFLKDLQTGEYVHRGITPLITRLNIGQREIKISKEEYREEIETVEIREDETTEIEIELEQDARLIHPLPDDVIRAGDFIRIEGLLPSDANSFKVEHGLGSEPTHWYNTGIMLENDGNAPVDENLIAIWDTNHVTWEDNYTLRVTINLVEGGRIEKYIRDLWLDPTLKEGWPQRIEYYCVEMPSGEAVKNKTSSSLQRNMLETTPKTAEELIIKSSVGTGEYLVCIWMGFLEPVVSDLDNDGYEEIIVYAAGNPPRLIAFRHDGTIFWSRNIGSDPVAGGSLPIPVVDDLDDDGCKEVVIYSADFETYLDSLLYAFDCRGNLKNGWPVEAPFDQKPGFLIVDLDKNGGKEIVMQGNISSEIPIAVFDSNGNIINIWYMPDHSLGSGLVPSPAVGNFDNDPELEIIYVAPFRSSDDENYEINKGVVHVFNMDGTEVEGWPVYTPGYILSSSSVGDIDNDGEDEIVVGVAYDSDISPDERYGGLYAFERNGTVMPGWPVLEGYKFWGAPALADFDKDSDLEIVISRRGSNTYILHHDGTIASGWPRTTSWTEYFSPAVGDVDGDGKIDVITTTGDMVWAWTFEGEEISACLKHTEVDAKAPAVIADIDNDGKVEIIASSDWDHDRQHGKPKYRGSIYVWGIDADFHKDTMEWPTFHHDVQRTGLYPKHYVPDEIVFVLYLIDNWNHVSVPLEDANLVLERLYNECGVDYVRYWDSNTSSYILKEYAEEPAYMLEPGVGYAINASEDCNIELIGSPWEFEALELEVGRSYLIGAPYESVSLEDMKGACRLEDLNVIYYDYSSGEEEHVSVEIFEPGKAYWVQSIRDCTFGVGVPCEPATCEDLNWQCDTGTEPECGEEIDCGNCNAGFKCENHTCITEKCNDNTPYGECSENKPLYCEDGNLVNKCTQCSCPENQDCNTETELCEVPVCEPATCEDLNWQCDTGTEPECGEEIDCGNCAEGFKCENYTCVAEECNDGTPYGECSETKPKYCEGGMLIDNCMDCGCPEGEECIESTGKCRGKADLIVESITVDANTDGVTARIKNQGNENAGVFQIEFWMDNAIPKGTWNIGGLGVGQTKVVTEYFDHGLLTGEHIVMVNADYTDMVQELDENNNARTITADFGEEPEKCGDELCESYASEPMQIVLLPEGETKTVLYGKALGITHEIECISVSPGTAEIKLDGIAQTVMQRYDYDINGVPVYVSSVATDWPEDGYSFAVLYIGDENPVNCPQDCNEECGDSDKGKEYTERGFLKKGLFGYIDSCTEDGSKGIPSGSKVIENYCENNERKSEVKECPNGCVNGACSEYTTTTPSPTPAQGMSTLDLISHYNYFSVPLEGANLTLRRLYNEYGIQYVLYYDPDSGNVYKGYSSEPEHVLEPGRGDYDRAYRD